MREYPFPIPFGWFQVGFPGDVGPGDVKPLFYFGRHLVLWRGDDGAIHLQDAFCPHLGAHLGHGGTVCGGELECPFHGWKFDGEGTNTDIPYSERTNRKAQLRTYPTLERNGLVMAWYHPEDVEPMWDLPEIEAFTTTEGYSDLVTREYLIDAAPQELAENAVDSAHFRYVHGTAIVPEIERYESDTYHAVMRSSQKFPTPRGVVEGRIDVDQWGPGFGLTKFSGIVDTFLLGCNTPIDAGHSQLRFNFKVRDIGEGTSSVGDAFVEEVNRQVLEDQPIWEHKAHLVRPALADTDGPFMKFRRWYGQFYAEGAETGEQTEFVPDPPPPGEPIEVFVFGNTASKRNFPTD